MGESEFTLDVIRTGSQLGEVIHSKVSVTELCKNLYVHLIKLPQCRVHVELYLKYGCCREGLLLLGYTTGFDVYKVGLNNVVTMYCANSLISSDEFRLYLSYLCSSNIRVDNTEFEFARQLLSESDTFKLAVYMGKFGLRQNTSKNRLALMCILRLWYKLSWDASVPIGMDNPTLYIFASRGIIAKWHSALCVLLQMCGITYSSEICSWLDNHCDKLQTYCDICGISEHKVMAPKGTKQLLNSLLDKALNDVNFITDFDNLYELKAVESIKKVQDA